MIALTVEGNDATGVAVLTVTGHTGAVTVTATPDVYRLPYTVRRTGSTYPNPLRMTDYEVPLGVTVRYSAVDSIGGIATAVLEPIEYVGSILASTWTPTNSAPVVVIRDDPHDLEARSAWFDVIGRRDPLVAVDVMRYRSGTLTFYAETFDDRAALVRLFETGQPLLLRSSCPTVVDDAIFLPLRVSETPNVDNTGGRRWEVTYQAVTRTLNPYAGTTDWDYLAVSTTYATYTLVKSTYATYAALALGPNDVPAAAPSTGWGVVL